MPVHLYGVVAPSTRLPKASRGRRDAPLRIVTQDDLGAVVSDIDGQLPIRREDLLAHARVHEALVEHETILPTQFGMVLPDDAAVAESVLRVNEPRLTALLEDFEGLVQVTVKAQHDEANALRFMLEQRPDVRALRDSMSTRRIGMDERVRLGQAVAGALGVLEERDAEDLVERLAPLAELIAFSDADRHGQVLDVAMLVRRDARRRVDQAIAQLSRELPDRLLMRYIGPQPPYSFMGEVELAGERAWA